VAKEASSRKKYNFTYTYSFLQTLFIKAYEWLSLSSSALLGLIHRLKKGLEASKNHYTVLIVPQKKNSVRRISASSAIVRWMSVAVVLVALSFLYVFYQYMPATWDIYELNQLRKLSTVQREQIHLLAAKINDFEKKMENLQAYDNQIRSMADMVKKFPAGKRQYLGVGGPSAEDQSLGSIVSGNESAMIQRIDKSMDQLIREASQQEGSFKEILQFLEKRKSILARTPSIWPVEGWVTSGFGYRASPFSGRREFHAAIDIAARSGKEIVAPADGIVSDVDRRSDIGNTVTIDHGNGLSTSYGHLLKCAVHKGKGVKRGEVIGFVGNTGRSTGSHVHYSVHLNGVAVNPRKYLP